MSKRIAIAAIGTMGDVQPFVALALTLKKRGHSVVLCATNDFEGFVTGHGVEFAVSAVGHDTASMKRCASTA